MRYFFLFFLFTYSTASLFAQEDGARSVQPSGGYFSGSLEANANFFRRDTSIGAANTPQYDHQLYGADAWLNLNYSNWGADFGLRFDLANNSYLLNPTGSYTAQGIGNWFVRKKVQRLGIHAGYIYDQIGSGIIYRAYEERALAIDNALIGVKLDYELSKNWKIKGFTGRQKQQFDNYASVIKGANLEGFHQFGDSTRHWTISPGIGITARTLDEQSVKQLVAVLGGYTPTDSIKSLTYNAYAFTAYNTLNAGPITWYVETAFKGNDIYNDANAIRTLPDGSKSFGKLVRKKGMILYSSVSFAKEGLGISLEGKRTDAFSFRTNPFVTLNRGAINFLPPMSRQNTYRLTARYAPATQELGEQAIQADIRYAFTKHWHVGANFSNITDLDNNLLYREVFTEIQYKTKKYQVLAGLQTQQYNQRIYQVKPNYPLVYTVTPYVEVLYKFTKRKALRTELQYMNTKQDHGSWVFALAEYSIAPKWIFTVSDMYNIDARKPETGATTKKLHYPTIGAVYVKETNRIALSYVKQVEGIVCTGGICRLEPAFSGVKLSVNSSF
jgi:Family of unknown function (DUF6029)